MAEIDRSAGVIVQFVFVYYQYIGAQEHRTNKAYATVELHRSFSEDLHDRISMPGSSLNTGFGGGNKSATLDEHPVPYMYTTNTFGVLQDSCYDRGSMFC